MARSAAQSAWIAAGPFRSQACLEMLFGLVWPGKKTGQVWPFRPLHGPEQSPTSYPPDRSRSLRQRELDARNRGARRPRAPAGRSGGDGRAMRDDSDGDATDSNPTSFPFLVLLAGDPSLSPSSSSSLPPLGFLDLGRRARWSSSS